LKEPAALEVKNLSVYANSQTILRGITFSLEKGERLLVVGRSGSGKTTLLRSLTGIAQEIFRLSVFGSVSVYGEKVLNSVEASKHFFYVPQEPWYSIATPYPVLELLFDNRCNMCLKSIESFARKLGVYEKLYEASTDLSAGEVQRLALLQALAVKSHTVLIDEITSYLDSEARRNVVEAVKIISEQGVAVVVVDHDIELWRGSVDKVLYIESGVGKLYEDPMDTPMALDLKRLRNELKNSKHVVESSRGTPVLVAEGVWFKYPDAADYILKDVYVTIHPHEVTWIRGGSGKGKSTLLKVLAGVLKPSRGWVKRFIKEVQLVSENPLHYISNPTVGEELQWDTSLAMLIGLESKLDTPITLLSSGERRRLAIASAFRKQPKLLLIDEPTVGLDPWNAIAVVKLLSLLQSRGSAIVVASHGEEFECIASRIVEV
jgi:ATPase components of various ABC-type transport systems, contain duplicated ATPase